MMCTLLKGAPLIDVSTSRTSNWNTSNYQLGVVNHQPLLTAALYNNQPGQNGTPLRGRVVAMGREVVSSHQHPLGQAVWRGKTVRALSSRRVIIVGRGRGHGHVRRVRGHGVVLYAVTGATGTFAAAGATGTFEAAGATGLYAAAGATGTFAAAGATGLFGTFAAAGATGSYAAAGATGLFGTL